LWKKKPILVTGASTTRLQERIHGFGTTLIFSILFGSIGMGYFVYGKKQQAALPLLAGIVLCIFPYFVSNVYIMMLWESS